MTSKSEIKRQTIQRGGSMDDATRIIEGTCKIMHPEFKLGDFEFTRLRNGNVWIRYKTGEGGEFNAEDLEAYVAQFFWENF